MSNTQPQTTMSRQEYKDHFYTLASELSATAAKIQHLAWDVHGNVIECDKDPMVGMMEIFHAAKGMMESAQDAIEKIAISQRVDSPL